MAVVVFLMVLALPAALLATPPGIASAQGPGWTTTTGIDPAGTSDNNLSGVSCESADECLSVGTSYGGYPWEPVTDALQASSSWVPGIANLETDNVGFESISCVSANWCMAVGWEYDSNDAYHLIAAVYQYGKWTLNAALEQQVYPYPGSAKLLGVSCTSETDCVAVGYTDPYYYSYYESPLVLTFDGSSWSQVSSISYDSSFASGDLTSVSCADSTDCAAVGMYFNTNGSEQGFAVELSPSGWTLLDTLSDPTVEQGSMLDGVSCPAAGQCEAVGEYTDVYGYQWALLGSLDGTSWTPDYYDGTPYEADYDLPLLTSVSCVTVASCVAVGWTSSGVGLIDALSSGYWDDSIISDPSSEDTYLSSVSCSSDYSCEAVGYGYESNGYDTNLAVSGVMAPGISGPTAATFTQGSPGSVVFTATGAGPVTLSESGELPPNITFVDSDSGTGTDTAVLSGTPGPFTGDYDFTITATDGNGNQTSESFDLTVLPLGPNPPVITLVSPDVSSAAGGGRVVITGQSFTGAIAVLFNGVPATSFSVANPTTIVAVPPPYTGTGTIRPSILKGRYLFPAATFTGTIGDVEVVTPEGATTPTEDSGWQYVPPSPSYVSPAAVYGGETVTIYGSFLGGASAVRFQGVQSPRFRVMPGGTSIQAVVPYNIEGSAYVEVDSAAGEGYASNDVVLKGPVVTKISPNQVPYDAGSTITITGADFYYVTEVNFGDISTEDFTVNSTGTQLTVVEPEGPTGSTPVTVSGYYGTSVANAASLLVNTGPRIIAVLPKTAATGSLITVAGTGLANVEDVYFGTLPAQWFYDTDTSVTVQVPAGLGSDLVNIRIIDPGGESPVTAADQYENG